MSLGHLILDSTPSDDRKSLTPKAAASLMTNWQSAGMLPAGPWSDLNIMLKVRLLPGSLFHVFPLWPRPAVWFLAAMMVVPDMSGRSLFAWLFVESMVSYHIISVIFFIGADFVYICVCKFNIRIFKKDES